MMTMKLPVILSAMIAALAVPAAIAMGDTSPSEGYKAPFDQGVAQIDGSDQDLSPPAGPSVQPGQNAPDQHTHKDKKKHKTKD